MAWWTWPALAAAVTLAFQVWVCLPLIEHYVPTNDDIALVVASTEVEGWEDVARWITMGFRPYFLPYPEWNEFRTDFLRPLANVLYWLHHQAFDGDWATQLLVGYAAHAVVVGLTAYLALGVFGLRPPFALVAILIAALNPAYWHRTDSPYSIPYLAQFPIYQTEIVCALLMLSAMIALIKERYPLFAVFGTLALLLKETALPLSTSALLVAALSRRGRPLKSLLWLAAPLGMWLILRVMFFQGGRGIYAVIPTREFGWVLQPLRNLLLWPTGLYWGPLPDTLQAVRTLDLATLAMHGGQLALNAAWWALVVVAVAVAWRTRREWLASRPEAWVIALVFALGNLAFVIMPQATSVRLGYLWFALGPAAIFVALSRWPRAGLGAAVALGLGLAVPQAWSITHSFSEESLRSYRLIKQSARELARVLAEMPATVSVVYLVDDLVAQTVTPHYKARLAGFRGRLIYVNNVLPIAGCRSSASARQRYRLTREETAVHLEYRAHECLKPGWNVPPRPKIEHGNIIQRGSWLTYQFPDLTVAKGGSEASQRSYDLGRRFSVRFTDPVCQLPGRCVWLGLDPVAQRYYPLTP